MDKTGSLLRLVYLDAQADLIRVGLEKAWIDVITVDSGGDDPAWWAITDEQLHAMTAAWVIEEDV